MNLYDLIEPPVNFHQHGPATEREAAARIAPVRAAHAELVLGMVRRNPGKTACELWDAATEAEQAQLKEMQEVRRRICDLAQSGDVVVGLPRKCAVKFTKQNTYIAREA